MTNGASLFHQPSDMRAMICVSFRCNRIKERTHVRQCRMVALLCNSRKTEQIQQNKKTQPKDKEAKSTLKRKVGEEIIIVIQKIRCVWLLQFLPSYPVLAPIMKTPRGDGVGEEGPETRSWRNTQRKTFFPAGSLGEDAAVLRSEHPFSDWLLEEAQGGG